MIDHELLISVIMPFYNTPSKFMHEAIDSVLNQKHENWELLLVDDGSQDESTEIAIKYADKYFPKIRYLHHDDHQNLGASSSRQLAINNSHGRYIGFLDSDDIWLPNKLEEQVQLLISNPEAGMLYGNTLYWFSWTRRSQDSKRDYFPNLGLIPDTLYNPPKLLQLNLEGKVAVPCTCSILIKREVLEAVGGFETSFRNLYTDQVLYTKVYLTTPVYVVETCWDFYRQHSYSSTASGKRTGQVIQARRSFLKWMSKYLYENEITEIDIWLALQRELWRIHYPRWLPNNHFLQNRTRWIKKWLLRIEERILPPSIRHRLWIPKEVINIHAIENNLCKTRINQK